MDKKIESIIRETLVIQNSQSTYRCVDKLKLLFEQELKKRQTDFVWDDNKVIDFVNWFIKLHDIDDRFELENQSIIDSFKDGDDPDVWKQKF